MTEQELMDLVNDLRSQVSALKQRVEDIAKQTELRQDDQKANSND
jgi:t-SNARE complex subunit (syntaxin)